MRGQGEVLVTVGAAPWERMGRSGRKQSVAHRESECLPGNT
jgi:hypothetical protein